MISLQRNKQKMFYALHDSEIPIYTDYVDNDGNVIKIATGETEIGYSNPQKMKANIAYSGGEAEATEYGLSVSDYDVSMVTSKNAYPIDETSLIWIDAEPTFDESGNVDEKSATHRVVAVKPSLNVSKYLLKRTSNG